MKTLLKPYILGTRQNRLNEAVLTSTHNLCSRAKIRTNARGVFQKYADRFHRMFAIATRLMIFYVKHALYISNNYR